MSIIKSGTDEYCLGGFQLTESPVVRALRQFPYVPILGKNESSFLQNIIWKLHAIIKQNCLKILSTQNITYKWHIHDKWNLRVGISHYLL